MTFNDLLKEVGDFGLYQKFLTFAFLVCSCTVTACTYWTQVFIVLVAPHRCRLHENDTWETNSSEFQNVTPDRCYLHLTTLVSNNISSPEANDSIFIFSTATESLDSNSTSVPCSDGWVYDLSLFLPTISTENNWVCEDSWKMYIIHTCFWAGALFGYLFFGIISDRYGRKSSFQLSALFLIASDVAALFVKTHVAFTVTRFFSAMGHSNVTNVAFLLVIEYIGPAHRRVAMFMWALTWAIISCSMPAVPFLVRNWRVVLAISIVPTTIVFFLSYFVPESACWLLTKGRINEAAKLMQRVGAINGKKVDLDVIKDRMKFELPQMTQEKVMKNVASGDDRNGKNTKGGKIKKFLTDPGILGLFKTPNLRKKSVLLIFIWTIACMCYNGNNIEVSNLPFNLYLCYSIGAIAELPVQIFCILFLDKFGRRWMNFGCLMTAGIMGIVCGSLGQEGLLVIVLALIMRSCLAAGFAVSFTFSSESFPTEVRGRSIAMIRMCGAAGSALAPFIVSLSEYDRLLPLKVFGFLSVVASLTTLFVPETAGQHLPHTLEEGEEFGKEQSFFLCPFKSKKDDVPTELGQGLLKGHCRRTSNTEKVFG